MRCVHLLPDTHDAGAERQALYLLEGLRGVDWLRCEVAYFGRGRGHGEFEALGIPMRCIPRRARLPVDWRRARQFRAWLGADPPGILHTWLFEANVLGALAGVGIGPTKTIVTQRSSGEMNQPGTRLATRLLVGRAAHCIANSADGAAEMVDLGMDPSRVTVVHNGVPVKRVVTRRPASEVRRELGVADEAPLVIAVGRAAHTKDFPLLAAAVERLRGSRPGVLLAIAGPTAEELLREGVRSQPWICPLGWRADVADLLAAADVVALSSWADGHSNVADEALLLGRPVATTDVGDHPALVAEAGGRVVSVRDSEGLAVALDELLTAPPDPELVRLVARRRLSVDAMVAATLAVYERVLAS